MKSIRRQLTLSLLAGFTILLGAGGAAIYWSTRAALSEQFDAALKGQAMAMSGAIKQEGDKLEIEFRDNTKSEPTGTNLVEFYEVRVVDGATVRKSRSLSKTNLPVELGPISAPKIFDLTLPNGAKGRAIGLRFVPRWDKRGKSSEHAPPELGLVLAQARNKLDDAIASLRLFVLVAGALTLAATVMLVSLALRQGLEPLERLGREAGSIDAASLAKRFPIDGLPAELHSISRRLNDLLARLEHSFHDISEYAAQVAHELRTPLTILRLKVEHAGGLMPPELADELNAELHHLTHVVDQSLLIAKAEQGRLQVQPRAFDLAELAADVAGDFSLLAQEAGRQVAFDPGPPCLVLADLRYARQIIHNLLSNSLKHGHGKIEMKLESKPGQCDLLISNAVHCEPAASAETLGLGLRVVETLLALQPGVACERHRGKHDYLVRLSFPSAAPSGLIPREPGAPS